MKYDFAGYHRVMAQPLKILVVDDERVERLRCRRNLAQTLPDAQVIEAETFEAAIAACEGGGLDCAVIDYRLPGMDGLELVRTIRARETQGPDVPSLPIIFLTNYGDESVAVDAMKIGATDYIPKSEVTADRLASAVRNVIEIHRSRSDAAVARKQLERANQELEARVQMRTSELCRANAELQAEITERTRVAEELRAAQDQLARRNAELLQLNQLARDFVDHVSHDFRTPLTVIKESASILYDGLVGALSPEQREYVAMVLDRASDLGVMVEDLLDMSRLDAGILPVRRAYVAVEELLDRVRPILQLKAVAGRIELQIAQEGALPQVYCDAEKLARAILNLSTNALKYCREGCCVRLWARRDGDAGLIRFGVTDDGPGIGSENLHKIFKKFQQVEGAWSPVKGFGLGLQIVRELVRLNLGEVTVESELGRGSTFSFTLPCGPPADIVRRHVTKLAVPPEGPEAFTVLMAETAASAAAGDHRDAHTFLQHFLRRHDLLFPAGPGRWLIVAACDAAGALLLADRFQRARREAARTRPQGGLPPIRFTPIHTWHRQGAAGPLLSAVANLLASTEAVHV